MQTSLPSLIRKCNRSRIETVGLKKLYFTFLNFHIFYLYFLQYYIFCLTTVNMAINSAIVSSSDPRFSVSFGCMEQATPVLGICCSFLVSREIC